MFSFACNSFWNFSFQGSAAVQGLLEKTDLTLDELLDEEGLLSEVKTVNQKLNDFLLTEQNFKQLISHVILEPTVDNQETTSQKHYKFPFVCCDVLSSECQAIISEFFRTSSEIKERAQKKLNSDDNEEIEEEVEALDESQSHRSFESDRKNKVANDKKENLEYLDYLFSFLDNKEINFTSAGYFAKIVTNLYDKKPTDLLAYIYETRPVLLEKMVNHVASKSIADLLSNLLTFESSALSSIPDIVYNVERIKALKLLAHKLKPGNDYEMINNASSLICEVFGKFSTMHCGHEVLKSLLDFQTIECFFEMIKANDATSSCAVATVLGNMFAYYILTKMPNAAQSEIEESIVTDDSTLSVSTNIIELKSDIPLIRVMIDNLQSIIGLIAQNQGESVPNQYGGTVIPFGSARMKLLELLVVSIKTNNKEIHAKLASNGFAKILLDLVVKFEWNNILHGQVEKIINLVLDGPSDDLKVSLFENAKILNFIAKASEETEYKLSGKHERKVRKGYLGHLVKIANKIYESQDPLVLRYTKENEDWKKYVETQLVDVNKKNKTHLGGRDPRLPYQHDEKDYESQNLLHMYVRPPTRDTTETRHDYQQNDQEEKDKEKGEDNQETLAAKHKRFLMKHSQEENKKNYLNDSQEEFERNSENKGFYFKFSQIGNAGLRLSQDEEEQEIEEEVVETSSPIIDRYKAKSQDPDIHEDVEELDESIEEDIQVERASGEEVESDSNEKREKIAFFPNLCWDAEEWTSPEGKVNENDIL